MTTETTCSCGQPNALRGKITVGWKTAIANALKSWREFILSSVVISSLASILRMLQGFVIQGLVLWVAFAVLLFAVHVSENARLQRKASRCTSTI